MFWSIICPLLFSLLLTPARSARPRRYLAFGDWGHASDVAQIDAINSYLIHNKDTLDGVFLLGDNFYPSGLDPTKGVSDPQLGLFRDHLAANFRDGEIHFFTVLGNHDYMQRGQQAEIEYSQQDSRWIMPDNDFFVEFPLDDDNAEDGEEHACVWFIDSVNFNEKSIRGLEKSMQAEIHHCVWRIIVAHYPVVTAGIYRQDYTVGEFNRKIACILCRFDIDFVISGHEHSSQVLHDPRISGTVFLIAGASTQTYTHSLDRSSADPRTRLFAMDPKLVWGDDTFNQVVLQLEFTKTTFQYEFIRVRADGTHESLFKDGVSKGNDSEDEDGIDALEDSVEKLCLGKCPSHGPQQESTV